jgi:hypothetical protein
VLTGPYSSVEHVSPKSTRPTADPETCGGSGFPGHQPVRLRRAQPPETPSVTACITRAAPASVPMEAP